VIYATYEKAKARGDNNVYFIDGETLFAICKKDGTVDGTHPNDLGFYSMAEAIAPVLEQIL
jgi:lysophospholipase L1-like esterase